jgi:hypothetical protein
MGDAVRDNAGLAGTGACEDKQRPGSVDHGVVLSGVKTFEDGHVFEGILPSRNGQGTGNLNPPWWIWRLARPAGRDGVIDSVILEVFARSRNSGLSQTTGVQS